MDLNFQQSQVAQMSQGDSQLQRLQQQFKDPQGADHKKLKKAAQQFEAIFFQQLLDAMDQTVDRENSLFGDSYGERTFRQMLNQNVAEAVTTSGNSLGLGLAKTIYHQMALNMEIQKAAQSNAVPVPPIDEGVKLEMAPGLSIGPDVSGHKLEKSQ